MSEFDFVRYLQAKQTVDDRALNKDLLSALRDTLADNEAPNVLEIGGGIGTMLTRLIDWQVLQNGAYTLMDRDATLLTAALDHLSEWSQRNEAQFVRDGDEFELHHPSGRLHVDFSVGDAQSGAGLPVGQADVLIANAVLDLLDLPTALPRLLATLKPGGHFYFTINYDGGTIFAPEIDTGIETSILALYNLSMDQRIVDGRPAGHSRTGRRLLSAIPSAGGEVLAAGSSDWVVHPHNGRYPHDEAYFLSHILHFVESTLTKHPNLDPTDFARWLVARQAQLAAGELIYIAHQLDVFGRWPG